MLKKQVLLPLLKVPLSGVPKIMGTFSGVLVIRIVAFWRLSWGPPTLGKYPLRLARKTRPKTLALGQWLPWQRPMPSTQLGSIPEVRLLWDDLGLRVRTDAYM